MRTKSFLAFLTKDRYADRKRDLSGATKDSPRYPFLRAVNAVESVFARALLAKKPCNIKHPDEQAKLIASQANNWQGITSMRKRILSVAARHCEENGDLCAKAQILGSLPHVELQDRFALAGLVGDEADEAIFDAMPAESAA